MLAGSSSRNRLSMFPIPQEIIRHSLRTDLPFFALAALILCAGAAAILLSRMRSRDPLLLWFGIFATLYGVRLVLANGLVQFATGADAAPFARAVNAITYIIPIPYMMFFRQMLGPGWKDSLSLWVWVQAAFAPAAMVLHFAAGRAGAAYIANNVLVLAGTLIALGNLMPRAHPIAVKAAVAFFASFVVVANFGVRIGAQDPEPAGFFVLLCTLAWLAARSAIARERQFIAVEQELQVARRVQASILPRQPPDLPGLRIAARYEPTTAVAGDFYDFIRVDDCRLALLVADVSGRGVPAALIASMLKVAFGDQAEHAQDPARVLTNLNARLGAVLDGQFVTAACAYVDLDAQMVRYAGAGHPPGLLVRRGGEVIELAENGLFLGPFRQASYWNVAAEFGPGDKLLLYTDGIIEAEINAGDPLGAAGLKQFAHEHNALPADAFSDQLLRAASAPVRQDDITVVVVEAR